MQSKNNPFAFPRDNILDRNSGMTLRDWFAGQVANGMAAHSGTSGAYYGPGDIAARAYEVADAMLAEREKER